MDKELVYCVLAYVFMCKCADMMKYVGQTGGQRSLYLPPMCDEHNWTADFFCLC